MGRHEEGSWSGTATNDNWINVLALVAAPGAQAGRDIRLVEGFLNVQTNPGTFMLVPIGAAAPSGSSGGDVKRGGDSVSGLGPASGTYRGYPIGRLWVRNTTPGSNVTIAIEGVLDVV